MIVIIPQNLFTFLWGNTIELTLIWKKNGPLDNDSWLMGFTRDSLRTVIRYDSVRFRGGGHGITISPKAAPSSRFQVWTKELLYNTHLELQWARLLWTWKHALVPQSHGSRISIYTSRWALFPDLIGSSLWLWLTLSLWRISLETVSIISNPLDAPK